MSYAWLSRAPNAPIVLADPNLPDPNLSEGWYEWKYRCNLDSTGGSTYTIDLADLMVFAEQVPWLWKACWCDLEEMSIQQASGGGEMLMIRGDFMGPEEERFASETIVQEELSITDQILQLEGIIKFLGKIWLEDPSIQQEIDVEVWNKFMESIHQSLIELQTKDVSMEQS